MVSVLIQSAAGAAASGASATPSLSDSSPSASTRSAHARADDGLVVGAVGQSNAGSEVVLVAFSA